MAKLRTTAKPLFSAESATSAKFIIAVIASIGLMALDNRTDWLDDARGWLAVAGYPIHSVVQLPRQTLSRFDSALQDRRALLDRIEALEQRDLFNTVQLQKLTALETENRRLRLLLESSARLPERVIIAELIKVDTDPYRHRILLDKGWRDGVRKGQPLLTQSGIAGQIANVTPWTSDAILITDTHHALPIQIDRTGQSTIAQGSGTFHRLDLLYLPNDSDIRPDDWVSTSGLGGRFPPGYPVGTVAQVEIDTGQAFARISVHPAAQLDRVREVLIVIGYGFAADGNPLTAAQDESVNSP